MALQCTVRPRGEHGTAVTIRSLMTVNNVTSVPLKIQLIQLEHAAPPAGAGAAAAPAAAAPPAAAMPQFSSNATVLLELGTVLPGDSVPIAPHLVNAHLRARPALDLSSAELGITKASACVFEWPN
eukprot:4227511-Prymnesium_polylepis.1